MSKFWDYIVIGGGIIGLSIVRELNKRSPGATVLLLEKESKLGLHGSGRNSGVLHSGIYYPSGTIKAKVCHSGSLSMAAYCNEHKLPINITGKVIVATNEYDNTQLDVLYKRGVDNGAKVEIVDERQLHKIEPCAKTIGRALFSPSTSVIDPHAILNKIFLEILSNKNNTVKLSNEVTAADPDKSTVYSNNTWFKYGILVNASGQFSDVLAHKFNVGNNYALIPFRGNYYKLKSKSKVKLKHLVYPVPNLSMPFLGIHSLKTINNEVFFGPSAIPAFGREHYNGVTGFDINSIYSTISNMLIPYLKNTQNIRKYANNEFKNLSKRMFYQECCRIVPLLEISDIEVSNKSGIRAQLFNIEKKELEMDFVIEKKENTIHVLNAVSPAFTSAFSMAKLILDI